ncbi:MAG: fibronectin type III domain-containing protein [Bryobacteraceae bacterium]|jgi:fibronectin type 3 domain-containing protein
MHSGPKRLSGLLTIAMLSAVYTPCASAQAPPVPPVFQDLYTELNNYLVNFNSTLGSGGGSKSATLMTGSLKVANSNVGPQLLNGTLGMQLQLNALKAMGAQAILVEIGFPMLYEPFLTSQGQSYADYVTYYQGLASAIRSAGLKVVVENDTLLSNDIAAGWNVAPFYATLNWTQYQQARADTAAVIAQTLQPDYMVVLEEPDTEAANSGQGNVNTPNGATAMLGQILTSLQQADVPNVKVGAGVGTWLNGFLEFIQEFVTLPVDFIDFHIYPVNDNFLPNALQIASAAAAAGKPVAMTECWLSKERDTEVGVLSNDVIRGRDPFSFWAPLDALFIQTMQKLAKNTQMLFLNPYSSEYYFVYQTYDAATENLTPGQILSQENSLVSVANQEAQYTGTGMSYYKSMVSPPDTAPPSAPGGLTGGSGNPSTTFLNWNAATDNVGVAGYRVLRDGAVAGITASLYFQDAGLSESVKYTYTIEAFDLAGNISAASLPLDITTRDVTPPSAPGSVAAVALSCEKVKLTWSPSTDNVGVGSYIVFWGVSPQALSQIARTAGTSTAYTNYPLTGGTTYYYAVEAEDKSGNISLMSAIVAVSTPMPPAAPANVAGTADSASKIGLSWSAAASGGLPIQNYHVYRGTTSSNLSQLAVLPLTSYTDRTVTAGTTYYYAVAAADTGGDLSVMSATVPTATPALPSAPSNVAATPASTSKVGVTWSASVSGGLPIQNYHVYRGTTSANLNQVAVTQQNSYTDRTVTAGTRYYYAVEAADTAADLSPMSATVPATTPTAPSAPTNLAATPASASKIELTWATSASGGLPIQNYHVYRGTTSSNLSQVAVVQQTSYWDRTVTAGATYYYAVAAADTAADLSPMSATLTVNVPAAPEAPAGLVATPVSTVQISLTWDAAVGGGLPIRNYHVYRGATAATLSQVAVVVQPAYKDVSGSPATTYYYAVQATDTGGDLSAMSAAVAATTLAMPAAPTNLTASAPSKSKVELAWTPGPLGMPLASYSIYRGTAPTNLAPLTSIPASKISYSDTGLTGGTTYYYAVQAVDTGSNTSPMSTVVAATTPK